MIVKTAPAVTTTHPVIASSVPPVRWRPHANSTPHIA